MRNIVRYRKEPFMYNICMMLKENRNTYEKSGILHDLNATIKNTLFVYYTRGKSFIDQRVVLNKKNVTNNAYFEVDFQNKKHYVLLEVYLEKPKRKAILKTFEVASIMCIDAQLDHHFAGISRMFNLPYFGNDLYMSTLLSDKVSQSILTEAHDIIAPSNIWFYYHDFAIKQEIIKKFMNEHESKKMILSDANTYNSSGHKGHQVQTLDNIEYFIRESTHHHKTTKYILQALPETYKHIYCINDQVFGRIDDTRKQAIQEQFSKIFKILGQETRLFGIEFLITEDQLLFSKLISVIEMYIHKNDYSKNMDEPSYKLFNQTIGVYMEELRKERMATFYANNRRQFDFHSKILDSEEGGKL